MITHGICKLALIPVRKEPSETSEMVTQILFGETVDILESKDTWSYIRCHFDNYTGWLTTKMLTLLTAPEFKDYQQAPKVYLKTPICLTLLDNHSIYLPGGSTISEYDKHMINGNHVREQKWLTEFHVPNSPVCIPETAIKFINSPYLWGGRTILGVDCSGFTQIVYKMNGITIPRDAYQQAEEGSIIPSLQKALPGDLAFFHREDGHIIHTGILLGDSEIIHASGQVKIDRIDDRGILHSHTREYSHLLNAIKRII